MHYRQNIDGCFAVGGLAERDYRKVLGETDAALEWLREQSASGGLPLLDLPRRDDDLAELETVATQFRERCKFVLVLGTGGSSLGGQALVALASGAGPKIIFLDTIDPHSFERLDRDLNWAHAGLLVISKSGSTPETMAQFLALTPRFLEAAGEHELTRRAVAITEPGDTPLRRLAARFDLPVLDHDPGIGGRFSALSLVGLLPAMIAGLDARSVRAGAAAVLEMSLGAGKPSDVPPAVGAALSVAMQRHAGIAATIFMPYHMRLGEFGFWFRQLWAESLGKNGQGMLPVRAMGTSDQHSQLQLYLDGPRDKMFTLIMGEAAGGGARLLPELADEVGLEYLSGHTIGDLLDAEQRATADTLIRNGRPVRLLHLPHLNEASMGALMMHFMLETIIAARLMGVDAFDQPAVEEGKRLARKYLAKMKVQ